MATVTLGNIKFNWKGAYNSSTAYVVDDVVSLSGSSYICIQAGTNQNPASASAYWEQMSSAGTNGTDLGTTLTTQGDIVYRDGSGLARLAAGTSGQLLQTGGAGANPSWTNVSSDFVKLGEHDFATTNATGATFDNIFDNSTYASYKIIGSGLSSRTGTTGSVQAYFRTGGASGADLSGSYAYVKKGAYREWNAVWNTNTANYSQGTTAMEFANWGGGHTSYASGAGTCGFEVTITGTQADLMTACHTQLVGGLYGNIPYFANEDICWVNPSTTEVTGVRMFQTTSNFTYGKMSVYGIK